MIFKTSKCDSLGSELLNIAQDMEIYITPEVIASSWAKTGLFPFSKNKIIQNSNLNTGKIQSDIKTDFGSNIRQMTMNIIQEHFKENSSRRVRVTPPKNKLFTGKDIIMMHESNQI